MSCTFLFSNSTKLHEEASPLYILSSINVLNSLAAFRHSKHILFIYITRSFDSMNCYTAYYIYAAAKLGQDNILQYMLLTMSATVKTTGISAVSLLRHNWLRYLPVIFHNRGSLILDIRKTAQSFIEWTLCTGFFIVKFGLVIHSFVNFIKKYVLNACYGSRHGTGWWNTAGEWRQIKSVPHIRCISSCRIQSIRSVNKYRVCQM